MGDPWGIGSFRGGGGKPNIKQIVKKIGQKIGFFFFTENALKCIRNPTKHLQKSTICQKNHKIGEIGKKSDFFYFTENGLKYIRNPTKHL